MNVRWERIKEKPGVGITLKVKKKQPKGQPGLISPSTTHIPSQKNAMYKALGYYLIKFWSRN